ncbi:T9SS type B sorting domain-containing protein [Brumimicrobium oceani]|uniref:Ig-like domain-containing protein n=1 Tax=Brumimicrobium oceani TaxID=2100725 RepID=A0A2U2XFQ5_9FLAO|nr:gliding motility-associated C-terminal domain-containing protein [Brumimicrobium oceani]PWH86632.1 hypothetical protein DIT68_05205 [Brumimicrobium oceani]
MKYIVVSAFLLVFFTFENVFAQQIVNHHAEFNSGKQNMWGPSFSPVTLDQTVTLFDESWNVNFNTGNGGITNIVGNPFGGKLNGSFSGRLGSEIRIEGFTTGTVEVKYPVDIELNMPTDLSYDQGDDVTIQTNYDLMPGWELKSLYPSAGEFFWDLYFEMGASASAQLCFFGCTAFPIIPNFNTGLQTINIATISGNGASTGGNTGVWFLGPAEMLAPNLPGAAGWPYAKPLDISSNLPWQVHIPAFPAEIPSTSFGLSGEVTIPYVETSSAVNPANLSLSACGDSTYFNLNLEVFKVLGKILQYSPPPLPAAGIALSSLSGSESVGIAELEWNFFSASFDANISNNQCFDFNPKVFGKFEFPIPVDYSITKANGTTSQVQQSSIVNLEIGESLNYKFPCFFEELDITPTYSIDGMFKNHTYDQVDFDFLMSAFQFGFDVPKVTVVPGYTIPEVCISIPYPCGFFKICRKRVCTPSVKIPEIGFPGYALNVGPLWDKSIPIGGFSYDWFNETWELEGFQDTTFTSFKMIANKLQTNTVVTDVSCYGGNDGTIELNISAATDALPYSYVWTNGVNATVGNSTTLIDLQEGAYQVNIVDNNGCQLFDGATIKEPEQLNISYTKQDKSCGLGLNDGSINITVSGGTPIYSFLWSNGATTKDVSGLDEGIYTLTVSDQNGCTETLSVVIEQPFDLTHSAIVSNVECHSSSTGGVDITVNGGTLPYVYSWSNGDLTKDLSNVTAGTYGFTVTDDKGCTSTNSYTITEPAQGVTLTELSTDVSCYGGANGNIDLTVTGGTPPYNYQWYSNLSGLMAFDGQDLVGLAADDYTVIVYDANACSSTITVTIDQPIMSLNDNEIITNVDCFGASNGQIDPQVSGGTAPYNYLWSNGTVNPSLLNVVAGDYSLTVTDHMGCNTVFNYSITSPDAPLAIVSTQSDVLCNGDSTGEIMTSISGGTSPYTILWNNGQTVENINSLTAGVYTINVVDSLGCAESNTITITEPSNPLLVNSVATNVLCFGDNDGGIDVSVTGGTTPCSYEWSDGMTNILADTTQDLLNFESGAYSVVVTDANGCSETNTSVIGQPSAPLAIVSSVTNVDCFGGTSGAIDISVSGGTGNYSFNWSNGITTEDLLNISAGVYIVTVVDQNGCDIQKTISVDEPAASLVVSTFSKDVLCFDDSTGSIETQVVGGTLPYSYNWSNGATSNHLSGLTDGMYSVTVTDNNGCVAFSGATINEPQLLDVAVAATDPSCFGYSDGKIELTITGGVQPYYFNWGDENEILLNNPSETINDIPTGEYFIRVSDENNCIYEELLFVDEPAPFTFQAFVNDASCYDGNDGSIDLTLNGGTTPYSYLWSNNSTDEDLQGLSKGEYNLRAEDAQGCIIETKLSVNEPDEIGITYEMNPVSCVDQSDAAIYVEPYGGTQPYIYTWSNSSFGQNLEDVGPGIYTLTILDNNNCSNSFELDVIANNEECLIIPNTFSPNGDLYNDTWVIGNIDLYPNNTVKIYNKWGNEIFSSEGEYEAWDGTHNAKALPAGVYYYIIILSNKEENKYTGNITIVR